jgi:biopolymer transport protein ExbD
MAAITPPTNGREKRRTPPRIHLDMTPMVDLGFLLITFFLLTTHLLDQRVMDLELPRRGGATEVGNTLTILLHGRDQQYGYQGAFDPATTVLQPLGGRALRNTLQAYKALSEQAHVPPICIIKAGEGVRYANVVKAVDEIYFAGIDRFSLQDSLPIAERELLAGALAK